MARRCFKYMQLTVSNNTVYYLIISITGIRPDGRGLSECRNVLLTIGACFQANNNNNTEKNDRGACC